MWTKSKLLQMVAVLLTVGEVHNLKCRVIEHSKRQGDFIDLAEQCNNMTAGERSSGSTLLDSDYSSSSTGQKYNPSYNGDRRDKTNNNNNNNNNNRRTNENGQRHKNGWRNNDHEFNVRRQDFSYNNNRGSNDNNNDRSNSGDRDSSSCEVRPQQYSVNRQDYNTENNNGDRSKNQDHRQGSSYYPSDDYDTRQSNSNNRHQMRRNRRDAKNNFNLIKMATTSSNGRLLGNNRFRNVTKNGGNQAKGSILDKMDACTIHCVLDQLEMLNSNSRPDKTSIVNLMTNQIKDVELKEFIQDAIDECFDTLELESHNSKCEFSKNFAVCMENKAQRNCDDWDENMQSTNKMNSAQDGNNQQDKKKGY